MVVSSPVRAQRAEHPSMTRPRPEVIRAAVLRLRNGIANASLDRAVPLFVLLAVVPSAPLRAEGFLNPSGIVLGGTATFRVDIAHEAGHVFGLSDIYAWDDESPLALSSSIPISRSRIPLDWGSDSASGFYRQGLTQSNAVERLLMFGRSKDGAVDIPRGDVWGVWYHWTNASTPGGRMKAWHESLWINEWKVLMTAVQGTSAAVETKFLSDPILAGPKTACTETYLVAGHFKKRSEAENLASYLRTRFVRFLVSLRKATQHATRDVYAFVPLQDFTASSDIDWSKPIPDIDRQLYGKYGLTEAEQQFIESMIKPME